MNSSLLGATSLLLLIPAIAAAQDAKPRPEDTEQWSPAVPVVLPGKLEATPPPSDAIVLFDGTALDHWQSVEDGSPARWTVADGVMTVANQAGNNQTRPSFGSYHIPLTYRIPAATTSKGPPRRSDNTSVVHESTR